MLAKSRPAATLFPESSLCLLWSLSKLPCHYFSAPSGPHYLAAVLWNIVVFSWETTLEATTLNLGYGIAFPFYLFVSECTFIKAIMLMKF